MINTAFVVEDCSLTMQMTIYFLKKLGIKQICTAANYVEFEKLCNNKVIPNLVITDWNIDHNLTGNDVIEQMSKFDIPIAVLTSEDHVHLQRIYPNAKCSFFSKPLNVNALQEWLKQYFIFS